MAPSDLRLISGEDPAQGTPVNSWLDFARSTREMRSKIYGADLFSDPAWDIMLYLGGDARTGGADFDEVRRAVGLSFDLTRRWLAILVEHGHVEELGAKRFRMTRSARQSLPRIILETDLEGVLSASGLLRRAGPDSP